MSDTYLSGRASAAPREYGSRSDLLGRSPAEALAKRGLDFAGALALLLLTLPVMLTIILIVRRDGGPVLFRHTRVGLGGRLFPCLKFRSMVVDAQARLDALLASDPAAREEWETTRKLRHDPRVTRIGSFLRRTSLDELPQIFNVLRGEMSLVGPRPLVPEEDMLLSGWARFRYRVLPGMTGPWQLGSAARFSIEDMASLDYVYVTNWSLWGDIKILMRTAVYVVGLHGR